jgi:hypothetical protein
MAQSLEIEPWPPERTPEEGLPVIAERTLLLSRLQAADRAWAALQEASAVTLGEKATAAVLLQNAQISLAAYDDFHSE